MLCKSFLTANKPRPMNNITPSEQTGKLSFVLPVRARRRSRRNPRAPRHLRPGAPAYTIHRRRGAITFVYTVDVDAAHEARAAARLGEAARRAPDAEYHPPGKGSGPLPHRPVVVGSGPAGRFHRPAARRRGARTHRPGARPRCRKVRLVREDPAGGGIPAASGEV